MANNEIDYRHELYKRFELDEHEIREGGKAGTRIQWFVYVRREAIQVRLDEFFFMNWQLTYSNERVTDKFVTVSAALSINGVLKEYSGGSHPRGTGISEDTIKAAYTDAFKRAASMWGIGLYLQNTPRLMTDDYPDKDWKAKDAREKEAWEKFVAWYNGKPAPVVTTQQKTSTSPAVVSNGNQQAPRSQAPQNAPQGAKHYACDRLVVIPRKDGYQYVAHCGHNVRVVEYSRAKYREALGEKVEEWDKGVPAQGKTIIFEPELQLELAIDGNAFKLVRVVG